MSSIPTLKLSNGNDIPQLGFGTFLVKPEDATQVVSQALEVGYRHIDTAQMYRNEAEVGQALTDSGINRNDLFITTKLANSMHEPDDVRTAFTESLEKLQTDYVDLFLIHWPLPMHYNGEFPLTFRTMLEFAKDGRARSIGVSNFQIDHLQRLQDEVGQLPIVNQIEVHPYLQNNEVREFCSKNGIAVEAWSPLAQGKATQDQTLTQIGKAYGKTAAQVALRWALQRGDIIFPKSLHHERMVENKALFDFELDAGDMNKIACLDQGEDGRVGSHPYTMDKINIRR